MIEAKDLRIGNWVSGRNDPYMKVVSINSYGVELRFSGVDEDYGDWYYQTEDLKPIELTPDILGKAQFYRDGNTFDNICLQLHYNEDLGDYRYNRADGYSTSLTHVHQIQNLYFALTGEDLKIEL